MANAGAAECRVGAAVPLGPYGGSDAVLSFDGVGGIAAWKRDPVTLTLQPIAFDGAKVGDASTVVVAEGIEPQRIHALGGHFVVLLRRWDLQHGDLDWWGVIVDRSGRAANAPATIGLGDLDIHVSQVLDERRIGLVARPGRNSTNRQQLASWRTLDVGPDRVIGSTAIPVDLRGLEGFWREAELQGRRGWVVERDGVLLSEGMFEGGRVPAAGARVRDQSDTISMAVTNGAVPPPRRPGGTIYEATGKPVLERMAEGQPVGEPLRLQWHGNPIAHGMHISFDIVWSGTHFIYPFWADDGWPTREQNVHLLVPIDCRP